MPNGICILLFLFHPVWMLVCYRICFEHRLFLLASSETHRPYVLRFGDFVVRFMLKFVTATSEHVEAGSFPFF